MSDIPKTKKKLKIQHQIHAVIINKVNLFKSL